jgi:hypothetical protein
MIAYSSSVRKDRFPTISATPGELQIRAVPASGVETAV